MKTTFLLALALCLAGAALLPAAEAGPVCTVATGYCEGLVCVTSQGARTCVGSGNQCDPAECPPDS